MEKKNGRGCIKASIATLSESFLKADPRMRIHVQAIYYEKCFQKNLVREWGKWDREGEKATHGCDFSIMGGSFILLLQGSLGT